LRSVCEAAIGGADRGRRRELLLDRLLDEAADPIPQPGLDRVEPGLSREQRVASVDVVEIAV
jgi:hypothetical protein